MATQQYTNLAGSSLSVSYTAGNTTLTLQSGDGALFPSSGDFTVGVDKPPTFFLKCTSRSGDVLTVGASATEGTTAASRTIGTPITHVLTAGAMRSMFGDYLSVGPFASRPASPFAGFRYKATDSPVDSVYDGTNWNDFVRDSKVTLPINGNFSWINQGSATVADNGGGVILSTPNDTSESLHIRKVASLAPPYTVELGYENLCFPKNSALCGLCVGDSVSTKIITLINEASNFAQELNIDQWSSPTNSFNQLVGGNQTIPIKLVFLKMHNDGTNRLYSWSNDGQNWVQIYSEGNTTFITENYVGFGVATENNGLPAAMQVYHFRVY
jgi:hypothetical protein